MPAISNIRVDKVLTNVAVGYKPQSFVAERIAPVVAVVERGGYYFKFGREEYVPRDTRRAIGGEATEMSWDVTKDSYSCDEFALRMLLPDQIRDNADKPLVPRSTTTLKLTETLKLNYEKRIQAIAQNTGTIDNFAAGIAWNGVNPKPKDDIDKAKKKIRDRIGVEPNYILMNTDVRDALVSYLLGKAQISYGEAGQVTSLPPVLWDMIPIVPQSVYNAANPGQTASITKIWGNDVVLFYAEPNPSLLTMSFMYSLRQGGDYEVRTWREEARKGEMIEVEQIQSEKIVCVDAAELITTILA